MLPMCDTVLIACALTRDEGVDGCPLPCRWSVVAANLDRFARDEPLKNIVLQT